MTEKKLLEPGYNITLDENFSQITKYLENVTKLMK